jgi:hypothetical protein
LLLLLLRVQVLALVLYFWPICSSYPQILIFGGEHMFECR